MYYRIRLENARYNSVSAKNGFIIIIKIIIKYFCSLTPRGLLCSNFLFFCREKQKQLFLLLCALLGEIPDSHSIRLWEFCSGQAVCMHRRVPEVIQKWICFNFADKIEVFVLSFWWWSQPLMAQPSIRRVISIASMYPCHE